MSRKARPEVITPIPEVNEERFQRDMQAGSKLALVESAAANERAAALRTIDEKLGLDEPYEYEKYLAILKIMMDRSTEAMLYVGRVLIAIKEHEPHGRFGEAVEQIGISERTAQTWMQATWKFSADNMRPLIGLGRGKLLELAHEDDETLEALAQDGTIAGVKLDTIQRMSVSELRKALRESKRETEAAREVSRRHRERADELEQWKERLVRGAVPTSELFEPITDDLHKAHRGTEDCIRSLDMLVTAIGVCIETEAGKDEELRDTATCLSLVQRMGDALDRLGRKLGAVQARYEIELSPYASGYDTQLLRADGLLVGGKADPQTPAED